MSFLESARFAVRGISANKLRSALTTLGIMIGVAAVIVLVAVGTGSGAAVQDQISKLGSNTLTVTASQGGTGARGGGGFGGFGGGARVNSGTQTSTAQLTLADAQALANETDAPDVESVAPVASVSSVTASYDGATSTVNSFVGSTPSYLVNNNDTVATGSAFTESDYTDHRKVALVGETTATELCGGDGTSCVGKTVDFNGTPFTIVGILGAKGSTGPTDSDSRVLAPLTTVQDTLAGYGSLSSISVKATSSDTVDLATSEVSDILNGRHRVTATTADYTVSSATSFLEAATSSTKTFTVLLASVAAISLLVGGIGVMNIMLVTVTERTREIGIRKAIGAGKGSIVSQFLLEATLLTMFGGLAGVLVGLVGSRFEIVGVQPVVAPYSVGLAFGVAVAVGVFFGLYPANRAASLRPIDALRYE